MKELLKFRGQLVVISLCVAVLGGCASPEQKADNLVKDGFEELAHGEIAKAMADFRDALQIKNKHKQALWGMALAFEKQGNFKKMFEMCRQLAEIDQTNLDVNLKLANLYLIADNHDYVSDQILRLEKIAKNNPNLIAFKAEAELRYGEKDKAKQLAEQALMLDNTNSSAYMTLAKIAGKNEDYSGALRIIDEAIDKNPTSNSLYLAKVSLLQDSNLPEHMPDVYKKLIKINPDKFEYKKELALLYVRLSQYSQAELLLKETLKHDPKNIESQMGLVRLTNATVGKKQALRILEQFVKESPESMQLKFAQFEFLRDEGDFEQSVAVLREVISKAQEVDDKYKAMALLADSLLEQGWRADAVKLVDEVLVKDPKNNEALLVRAKLHMFDEKYNSAIGIYRNILDDFPTSVPAMIGLGKAYEQSGTLELANESYYQAFRYSTGLVEVRDGYIHFLIKNKLADRAEQVLEELSHRMPGDMVLKKQLALLKAENGKFEDAHRIALDMQRNPKTVGLGYQTEGLVFLSENKKEFALQAFQNAYISDPLQMEYVSNIVNTYGMSAEFSKAVAFVEEALKKRPENLGLQIIKTQLLLKTNPGDARAYLQQILAQGTAGPEFYKLLVDYFKQSKQFNAAEDALTQGITRYPDSELLQSARADIAIQKKQFSNAIQMYDSLLRKHPDDIVIKNNLAALLLDYATSKRDSDRGICLSRTFATSDIPMLQDTVAWGLFKQGKPHQALSILKDLTKQVNPDLIFFVHLAKVYEALNDKLNALKVWDKVRAMGGEIESSYQ